VTEFLQVLLTCLSDERILSVVMNGDRTRAETEMAESASWGRADACLVLVSTTDADNSCPRLLERVERESFQRESATNGGEPFGRRRV
jgi:hypothetical protein